ncbi:MAG TPA: hypothetical protein DEH11_08635 [Actinobacteria bacterium]|jgi:hypothetical protein|nr:hypothetical protein [Actinomycetota bacterium]
MAGQKKWSDLSKRSRMLILAGVVTEGTLKAAAAIDLKRRPSSQIRGPKWRWAAALIPGTFGIAPLAYFLFGRRR